MLIHNSLPSGFVLDAESVQKLLAYFGKGGDLSDASDKYNTLWLAHTQTPGDRSLCLKVERTVGEGPVFVAVKPNQLSATGHLYHALLLHPAQDPQDAQPLTVVQAWGKHRPGARVLTVEFGPALHYRAEGRSGRCFVDTVLALHGAVVRDYWRGANSLVRDQRLEVA